MIFFPFCMKRGVLLSHPSFHQHMMERKMTGFLLSEWKYDSNQAEGKNVADHQASQKTQRVSACSWGGRLGAGVAVPNWFTEAASV